MKTNLLSLTCIFLIVFTCPGQTVYLDPQFGNGGVDTSIVITSRDDNLAPWEIALMADGKIAVTGGFKPDAERFPWVARLKAGGGLDGSFGKSGISVIDTGFYAYDIRSLNVQKDGKILISGWLNGGFGIYRFNTSGALDTGFGVNGNGLSLTNICDFDGIQDLALTKSGKMVAVGYSCLLDARFTIALFKTDGSRDLNFNGTGYFTSEFDFAFRNFKAVEIQSDNKIVAAGECVAGDVDMSMKMYVVRIDTAGNLDPGFGSAGEFSHIMGWGEEVHDMAIQKDGKILLCFGYNKILRLNSNGTIDNTFGNNGKVEIRPGEADTEIQCVGLQEDGKIIVSGFIHKYFTNSGNSHILITRLKSENGTVDNTFGDTGFIVTPIGSYDVQTRSMVIQPDNKILITAVMYKYFGSTGRVLVARFRPDESVGINKWQSERSGVTLYPNPADDHINLGNLNIGSERLTWQLFDLTGKKISNGLIDTDPYTIYTGNLNPSMYLLQISGIRNKLVKNIRIIKK